MHCPQCRLPFNNIKEVPVASEDPDGWFFCVDVEGDGRLSRTQVLNVLVSTFPLDWRKTEEALPTLWERWDRDGSGFISRQEFMDPDGGLLAFVRAHLLHLPTEPPAGATPAQWFRYFDDDHSGSLTRPQCMRALVKSSPALTVQTVEEMFAPLGHLTVHSCDILSELEDALRLEPRGPSARLHTVSDERFWSAIDERDPDDLATPRDGVGRLLVPVGRAGVLTGLPCPTCGDTFPPGRPRHCHACACGLQVHCSEPCAAADLDHNCAENLRRARRLVDALHGSVAIVLLSETLALPVRAIDVLCDLTLPAWYPQLAAEDSVTLFKLHPLVLRQLRHREDAATDARRRLLVHGSLRPRPPRVS